jgi:glycosyltransferase involved in cell wall biosynthesis
MRITFFTHKPLDAIRKVGFYSADIDILRRLGHDVRIANRPHQLLAPTDAYFAWWWTSAFLPVAVGMLRRKPTIITGVFNYDLADLDHPDYLRRPRWQKSLIEFSLRHAAANVFLSSYEHDLLTEKLRVANPHTIPLAVDTDIHSPGKEGDRDPYLVLNVAWSGRFNAARKCLFEIVESISIVRREIPQVRYVFCGTPGEQHDALVERVRQLGVESSVDFLGYVDDDQKRALMRRCTVYLSPSRYEGFGLAIAEAMSCGAAVVTSPVGSIPEVVGNAGLLVDGRDVAAISQATLRLLGDPALSHGLGQKARDHVLRHYRHEVRRDGLRKLIEQLV